MVSQKVGGVFEASRVILGCMRLAGKGVIEGEKAVMTAFESGITMFDHADIYGGGESETVFGEILRRNPGLRQKIVLQDKVGICQGGYDASKAHILEAAEGCLKRLGVEQIETLLLHRPDALMEPEEVAEAFETLHRDGKVKYFGVSNENLSQMTLLKKYMKQPLVIDQLQFGPAHSILVDEGMNVNMHTPHAMQHGGDTLNWCRLNDITIQAWSPFQQGMIAGPFALDPRFAKLNEKLAEIAGRRGVTADAVTAAWVLRHPAKIQLIAGSMSPERIKNICAGADITLTHQEWYDIYLSAGNPLP